ncbi:MAG: hypothetical protein IJ194_04485 [Bacilli bacterium]|nr:hypothetical protein [Bacilli bacterium]
MKLSFLATIMQSLSVLSVVFLPSSFLVTQSLHNRSYSRPMFSSSGGGDDHTLPESETETNLSVPSDTPESEIVTPFFPAKFSSGVSFNPIYTANYFRHLDENMPTNNVGNCAYVSLASVLGFFDSFVSDYFIDEQFEAHVTNTHRIDSLYEESPCVEDIYVTPNIQISNPITRFTQYVDAMLENGSFIGHLYQIAIENGYLDYGNVYNASMLWSDFSAFMTAYKEEIISSLNLVYDPGIISNPPKIVVHEGRYYPSTPSFYYPGNTVNSATELRQQIILQLEEGIPVIIGGDGHFCVAYEYDSTNDIIYGNWGYHGQTHANLDENFQMIHHWYSYHLAPNIKHDHSDNYNIQVEDSTHSLCSCELESHICEDISDGNHRCYCYCPLTHGNHSSNQFVFENTNYHRIICSCGRTYDYERHILDSSGNCIRCLHAV